MKKKRGHRRQSLEVSKWVSCARERESAREKQVLEVKERMRVASTENRSASEKEKR
ncbi:conserved hypothetical protein [Ricinus communis]|uniref:Uncharacterized protein n=1 Tax=Ricinus communis TaxID=3988 RepID=B9T0I4_RICCO|nr:conserved hypothetical protein [Ricinus communis]